IAKTDPAYVVKITAFSKYQLYVTIEDNPTAEEKKDCPNAYKTASPVMLEKSGAKKNFTPSIAPSNVNARTTIIKKKMNSNGIIYLFARSIPFFIPKEIKTTLHNVNNKRQPNVTVGLVITETNNPS